MLRGQYAYEIWRVIRYGELFSICMNVLKHVLLLTRANQIVNVGKEIKSPGKKIVTQRNMILSQEQKENNVIKKSVDIHLPG